jgi:Mce-associated membrane protein
MPVNMRVATDGADWAASIEDDAADNRDTGEEEQSELIPASADDVDNVGAGDVEPKRRRRSAWTHALAFGLLPGVALLLALGAGFLKWQDSSVRDSDVTAIESVQAAKDSTIALLSYRPDSVERDLAAARDRLTGTFRDSYSALTKDVVIPGAKQKQISAVATVPAAASVSANENHAVALVFVDQSVIVGNDAPTNTTSCVRVTLDKDHGRWLISRFDPV